MISAGNDQENTRLEEVAVRDGSGDDSVVIAP